MPEDAAARLSRRLKATYIFMAICVVTLLLVASPLAPSTGALSAQSNHRDCDANAVIRCGALSTQELQQKFDQPGVKEIFNHFGITKREVNRMNNTAVLGHVTKNGRVVVDGKTVATNAMTAGRQNIQGSTPVTYQGTQFYMRPSSASFAQQRLEAFVVMRNDRFQFAVLTSCGNPVLATPKVERPERPQSQPTPQPEKPAAPPPETEAPSATANATATATVITTEAPQQPAPTPPPVTTTVAPAPTPTPVAAAPAAETLPKTGVEKAAGITALATASGTLFHFLYTRRKLKQNL